MKKPSVQLCFNTHVHDHSYNRHPESYKPLIEFIHECQQKVARPITILDVGCGTGIFIWKVLEINLREEKYIFVTVFEGKRFSKNYDYENKATMKSRFAEPQ
jgi:2-polyprenyl-3-methyl-5-hydroxy-6-metoxy-1,4-benzoquinol methylase